MKTLSLALRPRLKLSLAVTGLLAVTSLDAPALASSHREAPAISLDPAADNTDVYAWVEGDKVIVIANYVPLEEPAGGPNFHKLSDDVRYVINISRGDSLKTVVKYLIRVRTTRAAEVDPSTADGQNLPSLLGGHNFFSQLSGQMQYVRVTRWEQGRGAKTLIRFGDKKEVAPPNIGTRTDAVVRGGTAYDDAYAATFIHSLGDGQGRVFVGPRDDGFYVDLGGAFDLAQFRPQGEAQDGVAGYNVHSIALEIPIKTLTADGKAPGSTPTVENTLGIWASAERRRVSLRFGQASLSFGRWVQVSRLGLPLINEAVIGIRDKDRFNATHPINDVDNFGAYLLHPVIVDDGEAVGLYAAGGVAEGCDLQKAKQPRNDILDVVSLNGIVLGNGAISKIGDVLRLNLETESGFPNGRRLRGGTNVGPDVTDTILSLFLCRLEKPVTDGVQYNDRAYLNTFPYLPLPHRGFDQGHGRPTPAS